MGNLCVRDLDHLFSSIEHSSNHFTYAAILEGDLYVPVVLILLVMTMSVMWFAWEV